MQWMFSQAHEKKPLFRGRKACESTFNSLIKLTRTSRVLRIPFVGNLGKLVATDGPLVE